MTEKVQVVGGEGSPEYVAYKLMKDIVTPELTLAAMKKARAEDPRKYYLDLYAECLEATKRNRPNPTRR